MATSPVPTQKQARRNRERIDVRLRPEQKKCIERAADLKGLTLTDFIIQNAVATANATIRQHESWVLERPDAELFFEALLHPPEPGFRLREAVRRYKEGGSSRSAK